MSFCFLCDSKLNGERSQVCTNFTPHSNVSYPEKIAELIGDEVVIIVTPADHMCKKCTTLLIHMDKLENDMKLVKNAIFSFVQKKYGISPPYQAVKSIKIVNKELKTEEQLEQGQHKVPSDPTTTVLTPDQTPLKLIKTQQQQQQQQPPTKQESANKIKVYKCGFCLFTSKEFEIARCHMRTHLKIKKPEKPILNQAVAKTLIPKRKIFRCQVCSKSFDSRFNCLDHIQKDHNQPVPSTSNGKSVTEDSLQVITKVMELKPSKTQENNQQTESIIDIDKNQQNNNKGTINTDMMFNDHVPTEGSADIKQEVSENFKENNTVKEENMEVKHKPAQKEEETAVLKHEEADQETSFSVKIEVDEDNANTENKMGDLSVNVDDNKY